MGPLSLIQMLSDKFVSETMISPDQFEETLHQ